MCLIVVGWQAHKDYPLIVAANRDEFHARPAAPAAFWRDQPGILAGRDLEAMGTWMGVSRSGRFAAVTNYRGAREPSAEESRGVLVSRFLAATTSAAAYMAELEMDDIDAACVHALAYAEGRAIATGRLLPDGHIGRMAVLKEWRGRGAGRAILRRLIDAARERGDRQVVLSSQVHALGFYRAVGFMPEGPVYEEAGIPHQAMRLVLR